MHNSKTNLQSPFLELFSTLSLEALIPQFRFTTMFSTRWTHIKEFMAKRDFEIAQILSTQFSANNPSEITVIKENLWRTQRSYLRYSSERSESEGSQSKDPGWVPTQIHFEYFWHFSPFLLSFVKTILWILVLVSIVVGVYWLRVYYSGDEKQITEVTVSKQRIDNSRGDFLQGETTIRKTTTQCGK